MPEESNDDSAPVADLDRMLVGKVTEWLGQVRAIGHKPEVDRFGWDLLAEFPDERSGGQVPLDERQARLRCKIQLKGRSREPSGQFVGRRGERLRGSESWCS